MNTTYSYYDTVTGSFTGMTVWTYGVPAKVPGQAVIEGEYGTGWRVNVSVDPPVAVQIPTPITDSSSTLSEPSTS